MKTQLKGKASHVNVSLAWLRACCPALTGFPVTSLGLGPGLIFILDLEEIYSVPTERMVLWKLQIQQRAASKRVYRRGGLKEREMKMPQRHLMRCRAVLLLVTTIYVLINQSVSGAEFLPQLEIISLPSLHRKAPSVGGYEGARRTQRGQGTSICSSLTTFLTLHLGLQLIHSSEQVHEEGQGTRTLQRDVINPSTCFPVSLEVRPYLKFGNNSARINYVTWIKPDLILPLHLIPITGSLVGTEIHPQVN